MSVRHWSSTLERQRLRQFMLGVNGIALSTLLEESSDEDSSDEESSDEESAMSTDGSSVSSSSNSSVDSTIDSSDSDDFSTDSSFDSDLEMEEELELYLQRGQTLATSVFSPMRDETLEFDQNKTINDFSEDDLLSNFRFRKNDLRTFADLLWPRINEFLEGPKDSIVLNNRYRTHFETCLLLYLFRLARPVVIRGQMEAKFGMHRTKISQAIKTFSDALHSLALLYLVDPSIWHERMPLYAAKISEKCGLFDNIWGFIDATIRKTCRPIRYQSACYTRYKRCHGIKFQSITTPDGMIANFVGPWVCKRGDARVLRESRLVEMLEEIMPLDGPGRIYALFGDLAYPLCAYILKGFVDPEPNSVESFFNHHMSSTRVVVEWGFSDVVKQWRYLSYQKEMKLLQIPVGTHFINAVFLTNVRQCFYGNNCSSYFDLEPPTLEQYLALVDHPQDD